MKAVNKIWRPMLAVTAIAALVGSVALASREHPSTVRVKSIADGPGPAISAVAAGLNYSTGFEASEGFALGHIGQGTQPAGCGGVANPCWGKTTAGTASLVESHIDSVHPLAGQQHLRLSHDPATRTNQPAFGLGIDGRYPRAADLSARPVAPNTTSAEIAIDQPFGMDFRFQPQSNSQGLLQTSTLFYFSGGIYVLDTLCGSAASAFLPTGFTWDSSGAYQNMTVALNPCGAGSTNYYYGGALIWSQPCVWNGTNLEQFLVFGDNFPGSQLDVDNVVLTSEELCPSTCGNGIVEAPNENCEPGVDDTACPGRCIPVGAEGGCTCTTICTLNDPCILTNGANGPFVPPCDPAFGCIFLYDAGTIEAVSIETCGSDFDTNLLYWGSANDPADAGVSNDDCESSGCCFAGSDPTASCYDNDPNFESCTCHDLPLAGDTLFLAQVASAAGLPPPGGSLVITINKKATCGGPHVGSCCDTNGAGAGTCTDGVLQADCSGAGFSWTENGKCASTNCVCVPDCTGRVCGDDGCGGSCGSCDDGLGCNGLETCNDTAGQCVGGTAVDCNDGIACTADACVDPAGTCSHTPNNGQCNDGNVCNGAETCSASAGCVPGSPLICDDGTFCNGVEGCDPAAGCTAGTPPCDPQSSTCDEAGDACVPNSIPTVSEWGLVVLTLLLLTGAKVYFGRRQAVA